jgi:hypothetical protein
MVRLSESIVSAPPIDGVPHQGMDDSSLSRVRDARLRLTKTLRKLLEPAIPGAVGAMAALTLAE